MDEWDWIHQIAEIHKSPKTKYNNSYNTLLHKCQKDNAAKKLTIITTLYYTSGVRLNIYILWYKNFTDKIGGDGANTVPFLPFSV